MMSKSSRSKTQPPYAYYAFPQQDDILVPCLSSSPTKQLQPKNCISISQIRKREKTQIKVKTLNTFNYPINHYNCWLNSRCHQDQPKTIFNNLALTKLPKNKILLQSNLQYLPLFQKKQIYSNITKKQVGFANKGVKKVRTETKLKKKELGPVNSEIGRRQNIVRTKTLQFDGPNFVARRPWIQHVK